MNQLFYQKEPENLSLQPTLQSSNAKDIISYDVFKENLARYGNMTSEEFFAIIINNSQGYEFFSRELLINFAMINLNNIESIRAQHQSVSEFENNFGVSVKKKFLTLFPDLHQYELMSKEDLSIFVRSVGPFQTTILLDQLSNSNKGALYNTICEYDDFWFNAYLRGFSFAAKMGYSSLICSLLTPDDIKTLKDQFNEYRTNIINYVPKNEEENRIKEKDLKELDDIIAFCSRLLDELNFKDETSRA